MVNVGADDNFLVLYIRVLYIRVIKKVVRLFQLLYATVYAWPPFVQPFQAIVHKESESGY